jgi:hypothetical protein
MREGDGKHRSNGKAEDENDHNALLSVLASTKQLFAQIQLIRFQ